MLYNLPLKTKLSVYVGAAITISVLLCISLFILHAATRIRSESESALRLATDFVTGAMPSILQSDQPSAELRRMIIEANNFRHIRIYTDQFQAPLRARPVTDQPPAWFSQFLATGRDKREIQFSNKNGFSEKIIIEANPSDEISEIWDEIQWIYVASICIISLSALIISAVVSNTLHPINEYVQALNSLVKGERQIHITGNGTPEFRIISDGINILAHTLYSLDCENHDLIQKMIQLQDNERKELATDLHDEFGPVLFMARVGIGGLQKKIDSALGKKEYTDDWETIDQNINKLQQINRRILGRLRPAALEEMGLIGAVEAMAQSLRKAAPNIELSLSYNNEIPALNETQSLTAYRIIQESLTNVYRHSMASAANVTIEIDHDNSHHLRILIDDNGIGIKIKAKQGIGLRGMQERILGAGGELHVLSRKPSGTRIEAIMPIS